MEFTKYKVGCVTKFAVDEDYLKKFKNRKHRRRQIMNFRLPSEELEEFNKHIVSKIEVIAEHLQKIKEATSQISIGICLHVTRLGNSYPDLRFEFN